MSVVNSAVLVSGGSRGIGRAVVECFAEGGADVYFTYHSSEEEAKQIRDELNGDGTTVRAFQLDVTDSEACRDVVGEIESETDLDFLVNNAGHTSDGLFAMQNLDDWTHVLDVELQGTVHLTKAAVAPLIRSRGGSCIVNLASAVGVTGNPGQTNHSAAKAGVIGFTRSLAQELGSFEIRVNAVSPGYIDTHLLEEMPEDKLERAVERTPISRLGRPREVASLIRYLCSDRAAFISGENIRIDGGLPSPA